VLEAQGVLDLLDAGRLQGVRWKEDRLDTFEPDNRNQDQDREAECVGIQRPH